MDYKDITREELIKELHELQMENKNLRHSLETSGLKNVERILTESEEKFRALYANMKEGSALHTLVYDDNGIPVDYRIVEVNRAFEVQLGIKRESVINKTSREAYGVDVPPYFELYSRVALTEIPEVFETYFEPLDKHFSINVYSPYKGTFATIFENITDRKKDELALHTILTKYKVLFEILPIGITISDSSGKIIESNQIAETLLGISVDKQAKRNIDGQEWQIIRPDGSIMPASEFASVRALEEKILVTNVEMGILKENNEVTWINVSAIPIPLEGYGVAIVYSDITQSKKIEKELLRSESELKRAQEITQIGSFSIDLKTNVVTWTEELYKMYGFDSSLPPPLLNESQKLFTPESWELLSASILNAVNTGLPYEIELKTVRKDDSNGWMWARGEAIKNVAGETIEIWGAVQNITERKRIEEILAKSEAQLRELNATKDKFFSIIAHDLKSPFTNILGFSEILQKEARNLDINSIVAFADTINSTTRQTFNLLENLLDWARLQQNGFHFEPRNILLNYLVKSELENLKFNADQKNIRLVNRITEEIVITADEKMLSSVLRNLISNAIKFTPKEGEIDIGAKMNLNSVQVSISDTGVGMGKETVKNLFKIETSFTNRGTENEKGTGLGLLLCKEFLEKHGGTIRVESEPGRGSRFTFSIPLIDLNSRQTN